MRFSVILGFVLLTLTYGQIFDFNGSFAIPSQGGGSVVLSLQLDSQGNVSGTLTGDQASYQVQGSADSEGFLVGIVMDGQGGGFMFEAHPGQSSSELFFVIYADDSEEPQVISFERQASLATSPTTQPTAQPANPLGTAPAANPLATADPWIGRFSDGNLNLELQKTAEQYTGSLELGGQRYPLMVQLTATGLAGYFESQGTKFELSISLQGDTLILSSGGSIYNLQRQGASNPLVVGPSPASSDPVIARGAYGNLSEDNAQAFMEAFSFALRQSGYTANFGAAEQQQIRQALIDYYAKGDANYQIAMARMREIWSGVERHWPSLSADDQGGVILEIFALAFGREVIEAYLQQAQSQGSSASSGGCQTIDDCIYKYASPSHISAMNGQSSCWSSSGCTYYDSSSNTQYYEERR